MYYILTLCILIILYVSVVLLMKYFRNTKLTNLAFCVIVFTLYLTNVLIIYLDVGLNDWKFLNTLPIANVSPFMFFIVPIYFVLPKKIKNKFLLLISLLSVGMLLSAVLGCIYNISINYAFHSHFLLDYFAHIVLSLWGVYIIKSKQVKLKIKDCLFSGYIIVGVAIAMTICNVIFDTSFFGLSLNGKHNIYNQVLVSNSYLSALIYFGGLIGVLCLGYLVQRFIVKKYLSKKDY